MRRRQLFPVLVQLTLLIAVGCCTARAQRAPTRVQDASALKPPPGARIAIVEFSDLQCPVCAQANPTLMAAAAQYKIPWVRHDLIIPAHSWSRVAATDARWFDQYGNNLGNEYRNEIFVNQNSIYNPMLLRQFTQQFAQRHGVALPFDMDPGGKLANEVEADNQLSLRTGVNATPTIFLVTSSSRGVRYEEVLDWNQLYQKIDAALADLKKDAPAKRAAHS